MVFNSFKYLLFLPVLLLLYFILPQKLRNWWLLACSWYFYMSWNALHGILLLGCTAVSYAGARLLQRDGGGAKGRKALFVLTLCVLFAPLVFYKYSNFLMQNAFRALRLVAGLAGAAGIVPPAPATSFALPVGISFFTFQAAGYLTDVYRRNIVAERNFFRYALFVSFFPQLVAGPIERSGTLLRQFDTPKSFDFERAKDAVFIMLWGYFLKMVLADRAAIFVNSAYAQPYETEGMTLLFATVFFAFQIYGDFYGYSLIAKGSAKLLGFELTDNFASPYGALNVQDFWRRWHISLSTWFRDYVYIPLGGSRCHPARTALNIVLVMALSGLWHGAGWHFVAWGLLHGILQVADRTSADFQKKLPAALRRLVTFFWVNVGWCLFRSPSLRTAADILRSIGSFIARHKQIHDFFYMKLDWPELKLLYASIALLLAVDALNERGICVRRCIQKCGASVQVLAVAAGIVFIAATGVWGGTYNAADFIYFQF